jgi:hypothetical protein
VECRACTDGRHSACRGPLCDCEFPVHAGRRRAARPLPRPPKVAPAADDQVGVSVDYGDFLVAKTEPVVDPPPKSTPPPAVSAVALAPAAVAVTVLAPEPSAVPIAPRRRRRRPPAPAVEVVPPPAFPSVAGAGTVNVTLTRPGPTVAQPPWTVPAPPSTYRARQDSARRVWPGRIHPRLKAARAERQQWHALVEAADRLLAANRWSPASKRLVAEVLGSELAGWLDTPGLTRRNPR